MVSPYLEKYSLFCQYFTEGEVAKGGNKVSSMLFNSSKLNTFFDRGQKDGLMGEFALIMDNCSGQNKNQMVIWFLMLMAEIGIFKKALNVYLDRGHKKCLWLNVHVAQATFSLQECQHYGAIKQKS